MVNFKLKFEFRLADVIKNGQKKVHQADSDNFADLVESKSKSTYTDNLFSLFT